jgi:hypothetical protein
MVDSTVMLQTTVCLVTHCPRLGILIALRGGQTMNRNSIPGRTRDSFSLQIIQCALDSPIILSDE